MTDDLSDGAAQDPTHALPDALTRRRLFGLAGATAAGAAGLAASGCSILNADSPKSNAGSAPAASPAAEVTSFSAGPPFKSRPDLHPPQITLRHHGTPSSPHYIFLNAPYSG